MSDKTDLSYPDDVWRLSRPESEGWSLELLDQAQAAAREFGSIAGVVMHRSDFVIWGVDLNRKALVRSVRKSLLSALIGIEVDRGIISLCQTLADLDIDDVPPSLTEKEGNGRRSPGFAFGHLP